MKQSDLLLLCFLSSLRTVTTQSREVFLEFTYLVVILDMMVFAIVAILYVFLIAAN